MSSDATRPVPHRSHVPHPGEVLQRDFLAPLDLSPHALALELRVPMSRVYDLVRGRRNVTPDTAVRLARYFGTSVEFWLELQMAWDLERVRVHLKDELALIRPQAERRQKRGGTR